MSETFTKHEAQEKVRRLPTICESHGKRRKPRLRQERKTRGRITQTRLGSRRLLLISKRTAASAESILVHRSIEDDDFPPGSDFTRADSPLLELVNSVSCP